MPLPRKILLAGHQSFDVPFEIEHILTSKAAKASKLALTNKGSTAASRSIHGHYMGGNPDSRGTESEDGITEDNEHSNLDDRLAHDATPLLMKIAQGDREDMHKYWSNKHSPGNGFYTGKNQSVNQSIHQSIVYSFTVGY